MERPDHNGPYNTSFVYEQFRGSTKSYSVNLKIFYPAEDDGQDAPSNITGAPYPSIVQLPCMGADEESYNQDSPRLVSWGFVCVVMGINWTDQQTSAGVISDMEDLLDQLERDNSTPGHRLLGMVNKGAFGVVGLSAGGAYSLIDGCYVPRLKAVQALAPALAQGDIDTIARTFRKPCQIQIGDMDSAYRDFGLYTYKAFPPPKHLSDLVGTYHLGPYLRDITICFFFRYLLGYTAYEEFLYGGGAFDDAANLTYYLNYTLPNGSFFPPNLTVQSSTLSPVEDEPVEFKASWTGFLPLGHPRGTLNWELDSDGKVDKMGAFELNVSFAYTRAGNFRVRLWFGLGYLLLPANLTPTLSVANPPPRVDAGGDRTAAEDEALDFTAEAQDTPSDNGSLQYAWEFGDGASSPFGPFRTASHAYTRAGNFTVRLTVRDDEWAVSFDTLEVTVKNIPPTATAVRNLTVAMDEEVLLTGEGNDTPSDRDGLQYRWDFGDGSTLAGWTGKPSTTHTYRRPGNFTAVFWAMDDDGATTGMNVSVAVLDPAPSASLVQPREGSILQKDEEVEFVGAGSDTPTDAPSMQYSWDFGDGNMSGWSSGSRASHVYTRGGNYSAVLRIRDQWGGTGEARVTLSVENQAPKVGIVSPPPGTVAEDEKVVFRAEGHDTRSDIELLNYTWEIGGLTCHGTQVVLTFTTEGERQFRVTVRDPEGKTGTAFGSLFVQNLSPSLSATLQPERLFANGSVDFSVQVTDTPSDQRALKVLWDFGDGTTTSELSGSHIFAIPGTYKVKVTAEDDDGANASQGFLVRVDPRPVPPPEGGGGGTAAGGLSTGLLAALGAVAVVIAAVAAFRLINGRRPKEGSSPRRAARHRRGG